MSSEIMSILTGLLCTIVSSTVTFFFTRRKYNTEVDSQQIENMEKSFDTYKKMMEETLAAQKRMTDATIDNLTSQVTDLKNENEFLRKQVDDLRGQLIEFLGSKFKAQE